MLDSSIPPHVLDDDELMRQGLVAVGEYVAADMDESAWRKFAILHGLADQTVDRNRFIRSLQWNWRWIAPHAIGFDGFRWHARAFCLTDRSFKDFLLSRIIETRGNQASDIGAEADLDWNESVVLEIGPHPDLSETQQTVIALDYGMRGGKAYIPVRKALLHYALKRLGLDTDHATRRPQDQQIVLLNQVAVSEMRSAVGTEG